jgi:hypothetical protein
LFNIGRQVGLDFMDKKSSEQEDQEKCEMACDMLLELIQLNKNIDSAVWMSALQAVYARFIVWSNLPYSVYCKIMKEMSVFYKQYWNID